MRDVEGHAMHSIQEERGEQVGIAMNFRSDMGRQQVVSLLAQLPPASKKALAMLYCENMRPIDIAARLGLTESEICQIHAQAVASIHLLLSK
jgi:RNA polymerase sigma factor (sigma-70 family)